MDVIGFESPTRRYSVEVTRRHRRLAAACLAVWCCFALPAPAAKPPLVPGVPSVSESDAQSGHVFISDFDEHEPSVNTGEFPKFPDVEWPTAGPAPAEPLLESDTALSSRGMTSVQETRSPQDGPAAIVNEPLSTTIDASKEDVFSSASVSEESAHFDLAPVAPGGWSPYAPPVQFDHHVPEEEEPFFWLISEGFLSAVEKPSEPLASGFEHLLGVEHDHPKSDLTPYPIGIQPVPPRPELLLELNEKFLGPGFLEQGIVTPTGAIWRPSLWVFGIFRTGINYFENGSGSKTVEWANQLSLFSQLNLTGTERILFGLRPLDEEEGTTRDFTGYDFEGGSKRDGWNADIQTLFFEGDFGEVFPMLDPYDRLALDYGFSIGRQPMLFQQGLLINEDRIDALTITRNTLNGDGILNLRATAVYAWNEINRHNVMGGNVRDGGSQIIGLFTETDLRESTINADVAYVWSDEGAGDLIVAGLSSIQRIHGYHNTYNSSMHILASFPTNGETNLAGQGELLFSQFSWTPHHTDDLIFLNSFWAIDQFTSASRGPLAGGPLGQTGLLFSSAGLGRYGAPLNNQANNVVGASLGYQMFFDHKKQQVVYEIGGRQDTDGANDAAIATGVRYQRAIDQHWLMIVDSFVAKREERDVSQGVRVEFQAKF